MKSFLQWFIALLQILFGLAFIAVIMVFILGEFDIGKLKSENYLKYVIYGCAGLYAALSLAVMAVILSQRGKARSFVVSEGNGIKARIPRGKVKKLFKSAAASVEGVSLKKYMVEPSTAGYTLKFKINVANRNVKEASEEFKGVTAKLCREVYDLTFTYIEVIVVKINNNMDAEGAKKEVRAESAAQPDFQPVSETAETPETETAPSYYAPPAEHSVYDMPAQEQQGFTPPPPPALWTPQTENAHTAAETVTVYAPVPEAKPEPIIKTATAVKTDTPKAKAGGTKVSSGASSAKAKTAAKTTGKAPAKTPKQVVDPNDPPPFKL